MQYLENNKINISNKNNPCKLLSTNTLVFYSILFIYITLDKPDETILDHNKNVIIKYCVYTQQTNYVLLSNILTNNINCTRTLIEG